MFRPRRYFSRCGGYAALFLVIFAGEIENVIEAQTTQTASSLSEANQTTAAQSMLANQLTLAEQYRALKASGATSTQLDAWTEQNSSRTDLQQLSLTIASVEIQERTNHQPRIPTGASDALKNFLTTQAALANARAKIHNLLIQQAKASGSSLTLLQVKAIESKESLLFEQQNTKMIALQQQQVQALSATSSPKFQQNIGPLVVPSNATAQLTAFLNARRQMRLQTAAFNNQFANASPEAKQAAMQQWRTQNAALIQNFQQATQALAQSKTGTEN